VKSLFSFTLVFPENKVLLAFHTNILFFGEFYAFFMKHFFFFFFIVLLFIYAYKAWVISPPCPHHALTTHSTLSLSPSPPQYPAETILPLSLILW
jgi:hypothetical protein